MKPTATLPKHPAARWATVIAVLAWLIIVLGLLDALIVPVPGLIVAMMGVGFLTIARRSKNQAEAVQALAIAQKAVFDDDLVTAELALGLIPKKGRFGSVPRAEPIVRAMVAQRRGQFEEAARQATTAAEIPIGSLQRAFQQHQNALAYSHRALARVALGSLEDALADARAVEANSEAQPEALARARLAEAQVLSRQARFEDLLSYMIANASLFAEHLPPAERATARALRKLAAAKTRKAVYREAAPPTEETEVAVAAIRPLRLPTVPARALPKGALGLRSETGMPVVVLLVFGAVAISFIKTRPELPDGAPTDWISQIVPFAFLFGGGLLSLKLWLKRNDGSSLLLSRAQRLLALGQVSEAHAELTQLSKHRDPIAAATAGLGLARIAMRNAAFHDVVALCHAAIREINAPLVRAKVSDTLLPNLVGELAVAYAASGRPDLAEGHLSTLASEFAAFPLTATFLFRVRLLAKVRAGDLEGAYRVTGARHAGMPLPRRDELLADVVQLIAAPNEDERGRIAAELSEEPALRNWIDTISAGLCDRALAPRQVARRVATEGALGSTDAPRPDPDVHDDRLHAEADSAGGDEEARAR